MLDSTFGNNGMVVTQAGSTGFYPGGLAVLPDGTIALGGQAVFGSSSVFTVALCDSTGSLASTFAHNGIDTLTDEGVTGVAGMTVQPNGQIIATAQGNLQMRIVRYASTIPAGILDFSAQNEQLIVYPDPVQNIESLEYTLKEDETLNIGLYDMNGRLIQAFINNAYRTKGAHHETLMINGTLAAGTYFINLLNRETNISVKVVKQ
jgi:hypothetical protein